MTMALHGTSYELDLGGRGTVGFTKQVKLQEVGGAEMNTLVPRRTRMATWKEWVAFGKNVRRKVEVLV